MSRMMPGRVRQEGIELYETGQLLVQNVGNGHISFRIAGEEFSYALDESTIQCSCSSFAQKGYCPHLAAVEYYLKNDATGRETVEDLSKKDKEEEVRSLKTYAGGVFLDQLLQPLANRSITYRLAAEGSLRPFEQQIDWTLKISRLPDQRSYVIRDIGTFLRIVQQGGHYQIGKNYYEQISLGQFDQASQDLLLFLGRMLPAKSVSDTDILIHFGRNLRFPLVYFEEGLELLQDLYSFQFESDFQTYQELHVQPFDASLEIVRSEVFVHQQVIELKMMEKTVRSLLYGHYLVEKNQIYTLDEKQGKLLAWVNSITVKEDGYRSLQVDLQDQDKLALALFELRELGPVKAPKKFTIYDVTPSFVLSKTAAALQLQTILRLDGFEIRSQEALEQLPFSLHYQHVEHIFSTISDLGFQGGFQAQLSLENLDSWYASYQEVIKHLSYLGQVQVSGELSDLIVEESSTIQIERTGSLLDISFDFSGIEEDEIEQAVASLLAQEEYFTSKSGKIIVFDEGIQKISKSLLALRAQYGVNGSLQLSSLASYQLASLAGTSDTVQLSAAFQEMAYELTHPEETQLADLSLQASLRDYQELGVKWLTMLDKYGFGGILADDMGLGKTLQTIAFLSSKIEKTSRVLILAPASLIYNWEEEFHRFAPRLDVAVVYGNKTEREAILAEEHTVVVTSYTSFRQDVESYKKGRYDYLILDEAQVMKNAQTKIAQQLRDFEVGNCFALSGTPIENHLSEIWSIFQIVLPGLLPEQSAFNKLTAKQVSRIIKPFVLRRKKEDVLLELPDLMEINVLNELTDEQKAIYLAQLQQMQGAIAGASEAEINRRKIEILSGITRLRQICDTPQLFMDGYQGESGKLNSLRDLLVQLKEGGRRVLIFSQFRNMLDIIEEELADLAISSYTLTGSTPASQRQEMTRAFNAGSRDAFLISLKAGGVGLNLTGADTVILVDLWWNPAVEAQAISRAHRMGQTETVEFYRLITRGTIEEKIQALQETKKNLVTTVLDGNESRSSMTAEDIKEILGLS
ncbi:DEAD/DEAH box helicase [Streptococcus cameli]